MEDAATVRWLAGAQITDITLIYQLMTLMVYRFLWRIIDAINHTFKLSFPIDDVAELDRMAMGFSPASAAHTSFWYSQATAIDGIHFEQKNPGTAVKNPQAYHCTCKGMYAFLCIAMVDSDIKFCWADF